MSFGMRTAFVSLPLTASKFQHRKGLLYQDTVDSQLDRDTHSILAPDSV